MRKVKVFKTLKQTASNFVEDDCMTIAASLAYYTLFSLPPLLVIITAVTGLLIDPRFVQENLLAEFKSLMGEAAANQLISMLHNAQQTDTSLVAIFIGTVTLLIGATGVVVQLQDALNSAWEVGPDPRRGGIWVFIRKRMLSFAMILAVAFVMLVSLVITTALTVIGRYFDHLLPAGLSYAAVFAINYLFSFLVTALLFGSMYKLLPDARLRWKQVRTGALVTAALFTAGKEALGLYLGHSSVLTAYGAAGSLVLVMLWIYYSALIFLFGAEFTKTWSKAHSEDIQPVSGAVHIIHKKEVLGAAA